MGEEKQLSLSLIGLDITTDFYWARCTGIELCTHAKTRRFSFKKNFRVSTSLADDARLDLAN